MLVGKFVKSVTSSTGSTLFPSKECCQSSMSSASSFQGQGLVRALIPVHKQQLHSPRAVMTMNEKSPAAAGYTAPESLRRRPRASFPLLRQAFLLVLSLAVVYSVYKVRAPKVDREQTLQPLATRTIPLEIHNIVKCPNAQVRAPLTSLSRIKSQKAHAMSASRLP